MDNIGFDFNTLDVEMPISIPQPNQPPIQPTIQQPLSQPIPQTGAATNFNGMGMGMVQSQQGLMVDRDRLAYFFGAVQDLKVKQAAVVNSKAILESNIEKLRAKIKDDNEALDIATNAIEILRQVSDEAVQQAYKFLEQSLNSSLERMFENTTRRVRLHEYTRNNQYPQLEIELTVANGKVRSLKADSGHGLAQIVSLLSILSLIVITNSRRLLVMDEVISGLSIHNREIITDILWTFTEIGFQFVVNEHGYVPRGSRVYHLEMVGDVSHVKDTYIEESGVYLQGEYNNQTDANVQEHTPKKEPVKVESTGRNVMGGQGFDGDNIISI